MSSADAKTGQQDKRTKEFVHLMAANQMNIYAYIMSVVGNSNDTDDIMQNTSAFMWDRYSEFKSGTDFVAWGISIAYFKIKEFRRQQSRHQFSDEVLEVIHSKAQSNLWDIGLHAEKLNQCLAKLSPSDLGLIRFRYESGNSIKRISMRMNVTVQAIYARLSKVHGFLSRCIKRSIVKESI